MFKNLLQNAKTNGFLSSWGMSILIILVGVAIGLLGGRVPGAQWSESE